MMKRVPLTLRFAFAACILTSMAAVMPGVTVGAEGESRKPSVACTLEYSLRGWSAFYKTAKGDGKIACDNGQTADVTIKSKGGGLTFGKTKIYDGHGTFSKVQDIGELLGSYAAAEAHAGATKSASAQALTKGEVSLALAGTGAGVDLGIAFSKFTLERK